MSRCSATGFYQDSTYFRVRVRHTGWVDWSVGGPLDISCQLDTTFYPFDRQRCHLRLINWAYHIEQVDLLNASRHVLNEGHQESGRYYTLHIYKAVR